MSRFRNVLVTLFILIISAAIAVGCGGDEATDGVSVTVASPKVPTSGQRANDPAATDATSSNQATDTAAGSKVVPADDKTYSSCGSGPARSIKLDAAERRAMTVASIMDEFPDRQAPDEGEIATSQPEQGSILYAERDGTRWAMAIFPKVSLNFPAILAKPCATGTWEVDAQYDKRLAPPVECAMPVEVARLWGLDALAQACTQSNDQAGQPKLGFRTPHFDGDCRASLGAHGSAIDCSTARTSASVQWDASVALGDRLGSEGSGSRTLLLVGDSMRVVMPDVTYTCTAPVEVPGTITCTHADGPGFTISDDKATKVI